MADQKLTELDLASSEAITGDSLLYIVTDPYGTPEEHSVHLADMPIPAITAAGDSMSIAAVRVQHIDGTDVEVQQEVHDGSTARVGVFMNTETGVARWSLRCGWAAVIETTSSDTSDPPTLGFFGATPTTRPQIASSTATVADLIGLLHQLGIVEDTDA